MNYVVIDVREPEEFAAGHVEGAINVPPERLLSGNSELDTLPKDTPLLLYCRTGSRSNVAMHILRDRGFNNLTNGINKEQVEAHFGIK